ncbi:MAG: hypothetical protein CMK64_04145 [Pseudoalteromonas sp.]|nr:hypothetical protein [Pseudoalteromonas sp.]|tara:strand:- start:22 stop:777 length:756 start_codon:yes stop_codon:yes gene_type:complete
MRKLAYFVLPFALSALSGCSTETTESDNVKTRAIWSNIYVTSGGDDSRVIAELNLTDEFGNNISLSSSDKLEASVGNDTKSLEKHTDVFDVDYRAIFDAHSENTQYIVNFVRSEDNVTLTNTLTLPAPFEILAPQKSQSFARSEPLVIEWSNYNTADKLDITLSSICKLKDGASQGNAEKFENITDDGKLTIDLEALEMFSGDNLNTRQNCTLDLLVERFRLGNVDSNYAAGSKSRASQQRRLNGISISLR